ncbi:hypothetical protein BJV82DRAFT_116473 [Fennellomyces sp. T-0311]|nr:hypothetical protein BJV82DRAFT_116473 [Fennellomyces sp. T-0311]
MSESNLIKLSRMMRNMFNDLVKCGVHDPTIGGILINGTEMITFVLRLEFSKEYSERPLFRHPRVFPRSEHTIRSTLISTLPRFSLILLFTWFFFFGIPSA